MPDDQDVLPTPIDNLDKHQTPDPVSQVHSEIAKHEPRDSHGRFVSEYEIPKEAESLTLPNSPNIPNPPNSPDLSSEHIIPSPVEIIHNTKYSEKNDPPLVSVSVTNPVTYLKLFIKRLLRNEGIDLHLKIKPITAILITLAFASIFTGTGFSIAKIFFPNSSPILHREVIYQGVVQKTDSGDYYLSLPNATLYKLTLSNKTNINLGSLVNKQVLVKGNFGTEQNAINVTEVNGF